MRLGVVGIRELLRDVGAGNRRRELVRSIDGALHAVVLRSEHDRAAEGLHHFLLFDGEIFGDAEDDFVAHLRAGERQSDAGVARGRLDDGGARSELAASRGALDHAHADAVLDREAGVEHLELDVDLRAAGIGDAAELEHRRIADEIEDVVDGAGGGAGQSARIVAVDRWQFGQLSTAN